MEIELRCIWAHPGKHVLLGDYQVEIQSKSWEEEKFLRVYLLSQNGSWIANLLISPYMECSTHRLIIDNQRMLILKGLTEPITMMSGGFPSQMLL